MEKENHRLNKTSGANRLKRLASLARLACTENNVVRYSPVPLRQRRCQFVGDFHTFATDPIVFKTGAIFCRRYNTKRLKGAELLKPEKNIEFLNFFKLTFNHWQNFRIEMHSERIRIFFIHSNQKEVFNPF